MAEAIIEYILRAIFYSFKAAIQTLRMVGTGEWSCAEAMITAQPIASIASLGVGCHTVEFPYSYRVDGELYTGLHEEPFFLANSTADYVARFSSGRTFVVRVKPNAPETSVVRERDQAMQTIQSNIGASRP